MEISGIDQKRKDYNFYFKGFMLDQEVSGLVYLLYR